MGLERGPLSLVSTIEELLGRTNSGSGLENRDTAGEIHRADYADTLYPKKLELTSPTNGGPSVGIVRSRTGATEFFLNIYVKSAFAAQKNTLAFITNTILLTAFKEIVSVCSERDTNLVRNLCKLLKQAVTTLL
jgi:hypothetical protein